MDERIPADALADDRYLARRDRRCEVATGPNRRALAVEKTVAKDDASIRGVLVHRVRLGPTALRRRQDQGWRGLGGRTTPAHLHCGHRRRTHRSSRRDCRGAPRRGRGRLRDVTGI